MEHIVFENSTVRLVFAEDATPVSLLHKPTGEELLYTDSEVKAFSVTQERPYNNEIKLVYMNQRTTFAANSLRLEGNMLSVGFELIHYRALVEVKVTEAYISFALRGFDVPQEAFGGLRMQKPPAVEFRLLSLPIKDKKYYGRWLNVSWDEGTAVNLLAADPRTIVDAEKRKGYRILNATALKSCKMMDTSAALVVSATDSLLDKIDAVEHDFGLPLRVESRRDPRTHGSNYWTSTATPENIDEHIALCKAGGFTSMLLYYPCIFVSRGYEYLGDYDFRPEYPEGAETVRKMVAKITEAGLLPGLHVLATHVGLASRYVVPTVDHRLRLKKNFTLARPIGETDTEIYVEEDPSETVMEDKCRVLVFGGEAICYDGYTTEKPYRFTGCHRGWYGTNKLSHPLGLRGGLLDVSEYCAVSTYLDQDSSLQDEIIDKIAAVYNTGFRFMYFDGAEGTNEPFGYHVGAAQYKMYQRMAEPPVFCTGAAKTHFGWHMLSGSNAFDTFPTPIFKEKIDEFPVRAAAELRQDFTVVNFGWWGFAEDTQPDTHEYGVSRAIAWDCPVTVQVAPTRLYKNPRWADVLEGVRRWQDANKVGYITEEMKAEIRAVPGREYTMLIDEDGKYEMRETAHLPTPQAPTARAYLLERAGQGVAALWSTAADGYIRLPKPPFALSYVRELGGEEIPLGEDGDSILIPIGERRYLTAAATRETLGEWLAGAAV